MRRAHWRRYPLRRNGSRRSGYYWVGEAHGKADRTELVDRGTVEANAGESDNEIEIHLGDPKRGAQVIAWLLGIERCGPES